MKALTVWTENKRKCLDAANTQVILKVMLFIYSLCKTFKYLDVSDILIFYRKKLDSFIIFNNLSGNMLQIFSLKSTERLSFYYCIYKKKKAQLEQIGCGFTLQKIIVLYLPVNKLQHMAINNRAF